MCVCVCVCVLSTLPSAGVDPSVKVVYKPLKRFRETGGLISKVVTYTYQQVTEITNTREETATVTFTDQVPRSQEEKLKVRRGMEGGRGLWREGGREGGREGRSCGLREGVREGEEGESRGGSKRGRDQEREGAREGGLKQKKMKSTKVQTLGTI